MLEEEAGQWWQSIERSLQRTYKGEGMKWKRASPYWKGFKEEINDKYFPRSWREERVWEFMWLKQIERRWQWHNTIRDSFNWAKYVPMYEIDEGQKAQKFISGLQVKLQQALSTWAVDSYKEPLNRALIIERNLTWVRMIRTEERSKGSKTGNSSSQPKDEGKRPRCKKKHFGGDAWWNAMDARRGSY